MLFFLIILIVIFKIKLGYEKDKYRYTKDIILNFVIFFIVFFCLCYIFGIVTGLARTENYLNKYGILIFIITNILMIILKEYLRYGILLKVSERKLLIILTTVVFIFFDVL